MALLPSITSYNIADLFTRPLPINSHHRYTQLIIGDDPIAPPTSTTSVATATVVATAVDSVPIATSDSVAHPVPGLVDTGASPSIAPSTSDFALEVAQASYGLIRSAFDTSVASDSVASNSAAYSKVSSTDPYTLITGEDTATADLSSPDTIIDSDSGPSFTKVAIDIRQFGTASLTFIYSKSSSELLHIFVDPIQVDWLHWIPLPRLTPTESYYHIFGRDYFQAFALLHLIPIWITLVSALVSALLRSE